MELYGQILGYLAFGLLFLGLIALCVYSVSGLIKDIKNKKKKDKNKE